MKALDLRFTDRGLNSRPFYCQITTLDKVVHTHVPLSQSSIIWYRSRGGDTLRLGSNRKSGVALAMRHILQWFIIIIIPGIYTTWGKNNNNNNNKQISIAP